MQSRDFCFWLQGFFELGADTDRITAGQAVLIRRHLDLVFAHEASFLRELPARTPVPVPTPPPPNPVREPPVEPDPPTAPIEPVRC
jgi:hypothetical protein